MELDAVVSSFEDRICSLRIPQRDKLYGNLLDLERRAALSRILKLPFRAGDKLYNRVFYIEQQHVPSVQNFKYVNVCIVYVGKEIVGFGHFGVEPLGSNASNSSIN